MTADSLQWWGSTEVAPDTIKRWSIGPATIYVERAAGEWRVVWQVEPETADDTGVEVAAAVEVEPLIEHEAVHRYGVGDDDTLIHVLPWTADRAVVARPVSPYAVPQGERVTVWVGTPVWVRFEVGKDRRPLVDVPLHPPSNTWFGPSPAEGELCYASRSVFRARFGDLQFKPHRAATTLHIHNQSADVLELERVNVPVPYLPLFASETGALWTSAVSLVHRDHAALAPLEIGEGAPAHAPGATLVAEPRKRVNDNMLVRAFSSIFTVGS